MSKNGAKREIAVRKLPQGSTPCSGCKSEDGHTDQVGVGDPPNTIWSDPLCESCADGWIKTVKGLFSRAA